MNESKVLEKGLRVAMGLLDEHEVPTEAHVDQAVDIAAQAVGLLGEGELDTHALRRLIEANVRVFVGEGDVLEDSDENHRPWLEAKRDALDWPFWRAYREYSLKRLPRDVVFGLDRFTDDILGRLEDPSREGPWDRRGMVVGQVQSGKTGNYTGLICKAADAGYPFIVVLAGVHNSLRSQTQRRIDEGFLGLDSRTSEAFTNTNRQIGVGASARRHPAVLSLTSSDETGDFKKSVASRVAARIGSTPVVLVVKKNKTILENLISWVSQTNGVLDPHTGRRVVRDFPILVIDDEADYASVNTKVVKFETTDGEVTSETDPAMINKLIRSLLHTFDRSALVAYTATPFANIFIDEEKRSIAYGEDLFPRSFILRLPPPSNYVGPPQVFGVASADEPADTVRKPLPVIRTMEDTEPWLRQGHKKDEAPGRLPTSLKEALRVFILVCAVRRARGQVDVHNSMLIHVTRFVDVQRLVAEQVQTEVDAITNALRYGDRETGALYEELRELWEKDIAPTTERFPSDLRGEPVTWEAVRAELGAAVSRIRPVLQINGKAGDALTYTDHPEGVSVIAVGGDKLSRGLTLEGLTVSYYLRASKMYDTLMQMGRWFGYRDGYTDLVRLYTSGELQDWYRDITVANEELHRKFGEMAEAGSNPRQFALYVRKSPAGLLVTAQAKMRSGRTMKLTFSDEVAETITFKQDAQLQNRNAELVSAFLEALPPTAPNGRGRNFIWTGVEGLSVAQLLEAFATYEGATKVNGRLMGEYIRQRLKAGELGGWTVALIHNSQADDRVPFGGVDVGLTMRKASEKTERGYYTVNRIGSPIDESLDLDDAEWERAMQLTDQRYRERLEAYNASAPTHRKNPPAKSAIPAGWAARKVRPRSRGLLAFYLLDPGPSDLKGLRWGVPGFLVAFPVSDDNAAIDYVVPRRYMEDLAA